MEEEEITEEEVVTVHSINNSLCILCCSIIPIRGGLSSEEEDDSFGDKLVKFGEDLCEVVIKPKRFAGYHDHDKKIYKVCPKCKILMTSAFTSKSQLDEMENHVRYLQMAILRALKVVDRHLKNFSRDLSKIGEVIKNPKCSKSSVAADVLGFRECILSAVTNLDQFRKEKKNKNADLIGSCSRKTTTIHQISPPEVILDQNDDNVDIITASQMETESITSDHDDNWLPDHDHNEDDNYDINDQDKSDHDLLSKPKRKIRKKSKVSSTTPTQLSSDLDLLKEFPRPTLGKRFSSILEPVTASMSPFKAAIVRRTFNKTKRKPRQTEPEGPLAYHYVTYNADTDILSVDNQIPIRFNELNVCLECTQCLYSCKGPEESETNRNTVEKKMMYHVLGKHMNIFKCEECDKPMISYAQYTKHREIHKKMGSGSEPVCEVCGRVLKSVESFEDHKWMHMTKEEKEEAKRQGRRDPADKFKNVPRKYQCQECGKGFRRPCELKKHMRGVHGVKGDGDEEGEGETFLCGGCGVIFKQMGNLTKHLKLQRCKGIRKVEGGDVKEEMIVN